jgi:hypothetical protein
MAKNGKEKADPKSDLDEKSKPWISMRSGLTIMAMLSIGFALYSGWQVYTVTKDLGLALQQAAISAAMIWGVFGIMLLFFRFTRR